MFSLNDRILLIDDVPYFRELVRNTLLTLGYKNVVQAGDGEKALQLLEQSNSGLSFRLIICDWEMPKINGFELLKKVRGTEQWKNLKRRLGGIMREFFFGLSYSNPIGRPQGLFRKGL